MAIGSEVSFMYKVSRVILMAVGLVAMCVILILFGFFETDIPQVGYLGMWAVCAGIIYYGAGAKRLA